MAAFILALHIIGWFPLVVIVAPEHHSLGAKTFGIGVTAYTLGMRHAFDADHIAALAFQLSLGVKGLAGPVGNDNSGLRSITGWTGTTVSGTFLGFDTATEIALLVPAGSGAASGLPWYAILCLPVLCAAGLAWAVALLVRKIGRIEERWTAGLAPAPAEQAAEQGGWRSRPTAGWCPARR